MLKRLNLFMMAIVCMTTVAVAQDIDVVALKAQVAAKNALIADKQGQIDALASEVATIQKALNLSAGWRFNTGGILGFTLAGFNNWSKQELPNSKISNITGIFNGSAILDRKKFFWRNEGNINLGWQQLVEDSKLVGITDEQKEYKGIADIMTLTSLFGYKITQDIAASALGQYSSSIVKNFNNPGILDIGAGATWTPHQVPNFVFTVHPLNYHIVFQEGDNDTKSALGAKIFSSYFATIYKGLKWKTDLNGFLEYGKSDPSLNEYTWNNTLSFPAWHGIGIGVGFGLRNAAIETKDMQSYYNVGLSYNL